MPIVLHAFRRKNPHARIPEIALHEPYIFFDTENIFLEEVLALHNQIGLTLHQSLNLLEWSGRIDEMEQRVAKKTTH